MFPQGDGGRVGEPAGGEVQEAEPLFLGRELRQQLVEIDIEAIAGLVVHQRQAVAVQDAAAQGGDADGAEGLGFLALAVVFALQDLDAPQAGRQHEEARRDPPRHEAEGSVALVDLVEDEHG